MLSHCIAPSSFCMSTMIPIPKGSGSMGDIKNYRGIALSSLLSKLFDTCIISSQFDRLQSNDLQFAYKPQTSTIQCVSSITETVSYYVDNSGQVYVCMLDASKAFDCVNLLLLFKKLLQRDMCPLFLRFLMNTYCKQQMRVKWNGTISNTFSTSNGVKQGGVLSPILFNVYLDELIEMLSEQGLGCHLHGQFVGAFIYADDVTLLAPTSTALNVMLETCSSFAQCYDLQFNSSKTKCMYFSKTHTDRHDSIYFMNTPIEFKQSTQLLGVHLTKDISDKSIASTVHTFYGKVNSVLYDFKNVPCHVKSKLLATYCLDLYGSQLWNYSSIDVQSFYVAWRKTIRRLWKLPNTTHCSLLPSINDCIPIEIILEQRCAKFIWSSLNSTNTIVKTIALSAISSVNSTFGDNYRYLSFKYNIGSHIWFSSLNEVTKCISLYISIHEHALYSSHGVIIRDLCLARDDYYHPEHLLSCNEIKELIEYLCIN